MKCTRKCTGLLLAAALVAQVVMPGAQVEAKKASKPVLSKKTVKVKEKTKKKVTVKNAKGYKLTVKSKNKKIATVSKQGKTAFVVKGVKAGKTKVVCTAKKKKKKVTLICTVKVDKRRGNVTQPTVSPIATNNNAGVTATPEPAVTPEPTIAPFPETDTFSDVPYGFADASENVEKGKIEEFTYVSKTTNKTHKVLVQLPANYSQEKQYPVLYLFHGENDTESIWSDMEADQIIDNAVTFKAAEDMIVVMPNISSDKDEDVMKDFADVLKPEVEAKYSVAKERQNTAVAGYGLGGRIALNIGLSLPEQVAYMGAFAPVEGLLPYDGGNGYFNNTSFRIDEKYKDVTFLMIQKGTSDDVAGEAPDSYHKTLTDNGSECLYLEMKGAHDQELFKAGLYNFARRIFKRGTQDESIVNGFVTKVPSSATKPTTHKGKIEKIEYETETYDPGNSQKIQKWANVYLPYDYDPEKKYNI